MANDYPRSAYPDEWQILGVRLRPFSLGHYLKLRRLGNAYVSDDATPALMGDLLLGIMVCSMESHPDPTKDPFLVWFNQRPKWYQDRLPWVFGKLTPAEQEMVRWGRKCKRADVRAKAQLFADYINSQTEFPEYWCERQNPRRSGAHWSHGVLTTLVSHCGYSQLEAYNVPLSKALQDFFKWAESEGHVTLMTPEESEVTSGAI